MLRYIFRVTDVMHGHFFCGLTFIWWNSFNAWNAYATRMYFTAYDAQYLLRGDILTTIRLRKRIF